MSDILNVSMAALLVCGLVAVAFAFWVISDSVNYEARWVDLILKSVMALEIFVAVALEVCIVVLALV